MRSTDGDALSRLEEAVDALAEEVERLHPSGLGEELVEIRRAADRLESVFVAALRRFERGREYLAEGAVSPVGWLRWSCRLSAGAAKDRLALARRLEELPGSEEAFKSGELGYQHSVLLARTADRIGSQAVREQEPVLLEAAARLDPDRFAILLRHLRHCADPDGYLADANRDFERRYLELSRSLEGLYYLEGRLDAEGGAALQTALNALSKPLPNDRRAASERRADALLELCRRQLDGGGLPEVAGQKPHLSLTVAAETLAGLPGQPAGDLEWGLPVHSEMVRRLACDAALTPLVLDGEGSPVAVGQTTRTIPPSLRRALVLRDRGCRFPGCDRPADWTDGHHLKHWADGGPTTLANVVLLCRLHHRMVHEEGWRLAREDGAGLVAIPPSRSAGRCHSPP